MYPHPKYSIQKITGTFATENVDLKILLLPVSHPQLNSFEMVWSLIKRNVAAKNLTFSLTYVEHETRSHVEQVTSDALTVYVQHAVKEENKYRELSRIDSE